MFTRMLKPHLALATVFLILLAGLIGCKENPVEADPEVLATEKAAAKSSDDDDDDGGATIPFADAEAFFEFNTTDNDLGLQIFLDAEGWKKVSVTDPSEKKIFEIKAKGPLGDLGITELRFESAEPSPSEVLSRFPEGVYEFEGKTVEGDKLAGESELSHDFIPAFTFAPANGTEVDSDNVIVSWTIAPANLELVEVILESDSDAVFDVIVEAGTTSLSIPPEFLEDGTEYKIELLAYHENGNRTIVESTFMTAP